MPATTTATVRALLAWMKTRGSRRNVEGMARYGIVADKVFGISVGTLRAKGKQIGRDHALARALWKTGWYEARMLAAFVDDPKAVTPAQMDAWAKDFDNWAICDTVCFHLFDKSPHAWSRIRAWRRRKDEFVKRAAFALMASVALHDKKADDALFLPCLPMIEAAATDDRNFVKKGVSWALRGIGRRSPLLRAPSLALATTLAASSSAAARWVGKDAMRDLSRGRA
jgi:3-methyladenine DNA glycosylase AlkD